MDEEASGDEEVIYKIDVPANRCVFQLTRGLGGRRIRT
jgi:hypothetical protein